MIGYFLLWAGFIVSRTFGKHADHHNDLAFATVLRGISMVFMALIVFNTIVAFEWLWTV